jgi:hypothetical protein
MSERDDWFFRNRSFALGLPPFINIEFQWSVGTLVRGVAIGLALCLLDDFIRAAL